MSSTIPQVPLRVPQGMTKLDVFCALFNNAEGAPRAPLLPITAGQLFKVFCYNGVCGKILDREMQITIRENTPFNAWAYDVINGKGSAQRAVDSYKMPSAPDYILKESHCDLFTQGLRNQVPDDLKEELAIAFDSCKPVLAADRRVFERVLKAKPLCEIFDQCHAKYSRARPKTSDFRYDAQKYEGSCDFLLELLEDKHVYNVAAQRFENDKFFTQLQVVDLEIIRFNRYLPLLGHRTKEEGAISPEAARRLLSARNVRI